MSGNTAAAAAVLTFYFYSGCVCLGDFVPFIRRNKLGSIEKKKKKLHTGGYALLICGTKWLNHACKLMALTHKLRSFKFSTCLVSRNIHSIWFGLWTVRRHITEFSWIYSRVKPHRGKESALIALIILWLYSTHYLPTFIHTITCLVFIPGPHDLLPTAIGWP